MAGGLHYNSLADLPPAIRRQVAMKISPEKNQAVEPPNQVENKYHNQPTVLQNIRFASKKEARRFPVLLEAQSMGIIQDLRLQDEYTLQAAYMTPEGTRIRAIRYFADYTYLIAQEAADIIAANPRVYCLFCQSDLDFWARNSGNPVRIIEDTKGRRTPEYRMKCKMMANLGHKIREL